MNNNPSFTNLPDGIKVSPITQTSGTYTLTPQSKTSVLSDGTLSIVAGALDWGYCDSNGQSYFSFAVPTEAAPAPTEQKECSECKGSGKYVGMKVIESCKFCCGTGKI